jgi:hypothetical protein
MATNSSASSMNNMKMIGAAIVIVIIIAVGAVLLTSSKSSASKTTTTVLVTTTATTGTNPANVTSTVTNTTASTAPTTTANAGNSATFQGWSGQNLSLTQYSQELNNLTFTKATMLNATYNFKSEISFSGNYAFSENTTGTTNVEKYYNSSRTTTNSNTAYGAFSSVIIYNATSKKGYICTSSFENTSASCMVSAAESIVNSTGILSSAGANVTLTGYFNNITVSTTSYKGQACTLVSGNLYMKAVTKNPPISTSVIEGRSSECTSSQYNAWLNQSLVGKITATSNGNTTSATIDYSEAETSISGTSSAAITALPGPLVSS